MEKSPCYKCSKRSAECHATCEGYQAFAESRAEQYKHNKMVNESYIGFNKEKVRGFSTKKLKGEKYRG